MASIGNGTIQINESTYNDAVKKIEKANNRIEANKKNIKVEYENCSMSYLDEYKNIITNLATALEQYYNLVSEDIKSLRDVRDTLKAADKL
ncbi:DUF5344 family protein [Roseburia sp. 499]|uniref:DUF5344 family protein n=1 Tax=Roseburia sp. 499 TaxID=1261634 RepID=UPI0009514C2A|nr:DUF5344 family protein [Roseburia sp. 499]WVK69533.1 DUF5344 family protein [Roseburia sp. 499]